MDSAIAIVWRVASLAESRARIAGWAFSENAQPAMRAFDAMPEPRLPRAQMAQMDVHRAQNGSDGARRYKC